MKKKVIIALLAGLIVFVSSCAPVVSTGGPSSGSPSYCGQPSSVTHQEVTNGHDYNIETTYVVAAPSGCDLPDLYCVTSDYDGTFSCVKLDE